MSRGIGKTQQRILDELAASTDRWFLTVVELAERLGVSDRQVRRAVHALHVRGLVVLTKEHANWKGRGQYGRRVTRSRLVDDPDGDRIRYEGSYRGVPKEGDRIGLRHKDGTAWILGTPVQCRQEWYTELVGMPTGASLCVWLPEQRAERLDGVRRVYGDRMVGIFRENDVPKPAS